MDIFKHAHTRLHVNSANKHNTRECTRTHTNPPVYLHKLKMYTLHQEKSNLSVPACSFIKTHTHAHARTRTRTRTLTYTHSLTLTHTGWQQPHSNVFRKLLCHPKLVPYLKELCGEVPTLPYKHFPLSFPHEYFLTTLPHKYFSPTLPCKRFSNVSLYICLCIYASMYRCYRTVDVLCISDLFKPSHVSTSPMYLCILVSMYLVRMYLCVYVSMYIYVCMHQCVY